MTSLARPAPVAVVGAGVKTPAGNGVGDLWRNLCAARPSAEVFEDDRLPPGTAALVCQVSGFDPAAYLTPIEVRRLDRSYALAIGAAADALGQCGALPAPARRAVVCGVGLGAASTYEEQASRLLGQGVRGLSPLTIPMVMPRSAAAHLSLRFGFEGPCLTVSAACASGAAAIGEGVELLRRGAADVVLAGGVDSLVGYGAMCCFMRLDAMSRNVGCPDLASRPFDADRDGFVMGEGAGCCMAQALADAGVQPRDLAHVNAHGTSTVLNDRAEAAALAALFAGSCPPVMAVKGSTGHMIAGSGAVEAIVSLISLRHRLVPPVAGLRTVDPDFDLDVVQGTPRDGQPRRAHQAEPYRCPRLVPVGPLRAEDLQLEAEQGHHGAGRGRHHPAGDSEAVLAHRQVQAAHEADQGGVLQALVAARYAHPAHVHDRAAWLHDDPAGFLRRQAGPQHHPSRAHRHVPVPPDDLYGAVVILVALHPAGDVIGGAPSAVDHGTAAQTVRDLAFGVVGRHPVVERGHRQHPGDERIERHTIHGTTLSCPAGAANKHLGGATPSTMRPGTSGLAPIPLTLFMLAACFCWWGRVWWRQRFWWRWTAGLAGVGCGARRV